MVQEIKEGDGYWALLLDNQFTIWRCVKSRWSKRFTNINELLEDYPITNKDKPIAAIWFVYKRKTKNSPLRAVEIERIKISTAKDYELAVRAA